MEGALEELLVLVARGEDYTQFMLARMGAACAPEPLPAPRHNAFRRAPRLCPPLWHSTACKWGGTNPVVCTISI